jgi:hypothetical protein
MIYAIKLQSNHTSTRRRRGGFPADQAADARGSAEALLRSPPRAA